MDIQTSNGLVTIYQLKNNQQALRDVYNLRVICRNDLGYITHEGYPNGWKDELDDNSEHFIAVCDSKIIGAGRLTLVNDIKQHPYFLAIENILPEDIAKKSIGYISRDDVLHAFRGNGIQKALFNARYKLCIQNNLADVLIDVPIEGYQVEHYTKEGYSNLGVMDSSKIHWELGPSILMHKQL